MNHENLPSRFAAVTCAVTLIGFMALGLFGPTSYDSFLRPPAGPVAYWALIATACVLTVLMCFIPGRRDFWFAVTVLSGIFILSLSLFQLSPGSILVFSVLVIVQLSVYERLPVNLIGSLAVVAITLPGLVHTGGLSLRESVAYCLVLSVLSLFASLTTWYREKLIPLFRYTETLENNVVVLSRANYILQDVGRKVENASRRAERQRLSRDLHDAVGYVLTNNAVMLETIKLMATTHPERIPAYAERIRANTEYGLTEIKNVLRELRTREFIESPVPVVLKRLVSTFSVSTGVAVRLEFGNSKSSSIRLHADAVYHMVQEGMINAFRHGRANAILITFWQEESDLRVTVTDDGVGAPAFIAEGIGLSGMRERVTASNGAFSYGSGPVGFEIRAVMPLTVPEATQDAIADTLSPQRERPGLDPQSAVDAENLSGDEA